MTREEQKKYLQIPRGQCRKGRRILPYIPGKKGWSWKLGFRVTISGLHNQVNFVPPNRIAPGNDSSFPEDIQAKDSSQEFCGSHFFLETGEGTEPKDFRSLFQIHDSVALPRVQWLSLDDAVMSHLSRKHPTQRDSEILDSREMSWLTWSAEGYIISRMKKPRLREVT